MDVPVEAIEAVEAKWRESRRHLPLPGAWVHGWSWPMSRVAAISSTLAYHNGAIAALAEVKAHARSRKPCRD